MTSSFLNYRRGIYFWLAMLFTLICVAAYLIHDPTPEPNGGTPLGYTFGGIGTGLIVWLMYLGRRRYNFYKGWGNFRGWVSAHVYFGTALLVVATLHTGFQFGPNIHTVAYALMCLAILSGFYGVWAYRTFPQARNELKKSKTLDDVFSELEEINTQIRRLLDTEDNEFDNHIRNAIVSAIDRTQVGGNLIDQLSGRDKSRVVIEGDVQRNRDQQRLIDYLVRELSAARGKKAETLSVAVKACGNRQKLLRTIRDDIRMHGRQGIWLLFHVPLSFGLLAALIAHVVSVFLYC